MERPTTEFSHKSGGRALSAVFRIGFLTNLKKLFLINREFTTHILDLGKGWPKGMNYNLWYREIYEKG
jgi:hypothetical protein